MKKTTLTVTAALILLLLCAGAARGYFGPGDDRTISEVATDFYVYVSHGKVSWLTGMMTPDLRERLANRTGEDPLNRLDEMLVLAGRVKEGKVKMFIRGNQVNAGSIDGDRVKVTVRYKYTTVIDGKKTNHKGIDVMILRRVRSRYFLEDLRKK